MKNSEKAYDNFIEVPFDVDNLDRFIIRNAILKAVQEFIPLMSGTLLDMGCGKMPYRKLIENTSSIEKYVGLDIETAIVYDESVRPDYTWDGITMPFESTSYDGVIATEVLEHCPDPAATLREVSRVLRPGGTFFFTTPFFWNLHEVPHDEYRYTPFALKRLLAAQGFSDIQIKAAGGWHASLAQMLGLWVRRAPLTERKRKYFSLILKPIIKKLVAWDRNFKIDFNKGAMITTLYGTAKKS